MCPKLYLNRMVHPHNESIDRLVKSLLVRLSNTLRNIMWNVRGSSICSKNEEVNGRLDVFGVPINVYINE